jgi:hypothetical protein
MDADGMIQVYLQVTKGTVKLRKNLVRLGFRVDLYNEGQRIFQGWIPPREIANIANLRGVIRIALPHYAVLR